MSTADPTPSRRDRIRTAAKQHSLLAAVLAIDLFMIVITFSGAANVFTQIHDFWIKWPSVLVAIPAIIGFGRYATGGFGRGAVTALVAIISFAAVIEPTAWFWGLFGLINPASFAILAGLWAILAFILCAKALTPAPEPTPTPAP